jgi:hypothetical protein
MKLMALVVVRGPGAPEGSRLALRAPWGWLVTCVSQRLWIRPAK